MWQKAFRRTLLVAAASLALLLASAIERQTRGSEPMRGVVSEVSYVIYLAGKSVNAQNGLTGEVDFSGEDAAEIIQSAIDETVRRTKGGTVFIKAGEYTLRKAILLRNALWLKGEGRATVLKQENPEDPALLFIGNRRKGEVEEWEKTGKASWEGADAYHVRYYRKFGITSDSHASLRISDLTLIGPGQSGTGDGLRIEWLNAYDGPCIIEGLRIMNFGGWQIYSYFNYSGAFVIRDSKVGSNEIGDGIYIDRTNGGSIQNVEIHNVKEGGTGLLVRQSWSFALRNVISEFNYRHRGGKAFVVKGWQKGLTMDSCYTESCEYGLVIEGNEGTTDVSAIRITGSHFNNVYPIVINNAENVLIEANYLDTIVGNYNVIIGENTKNIRHDLNTINRGLGVKSGTPSPSGNDDTWEPSK